jgi:hypothetical protein
VKILKHLAGIFLATVGLAMALGSCTLAFQEDEDIPLWGLVIILLLGLSAMLGAVALLKRRANDLPSRTCPKCGSQDKARAGIVGTGNILYVVAYFLIWLFPLSLLWGASRKQQVRCVNCDTLYLIETRGTRIAGIVFWVLVLLFILGRLGQSLSPP